MNKDTTNTYSQHTCNMGNTHDANQLSSIYRSGSNRMPVIEAYRDNEAVEDDYKYRNRNAFLHCEVLKEQDIELTIKNSSTVNLTISKINKLVTYNEDL